MPIKLRLPFAAALILAAFQAAVSAQWLDYPTGGVPRTPDGKPNLSAPAPRTADGQPDLSGMWGWDTPAQIAARAAMISRLAREFMNIAASRKGALPYQPGRGRSGEETDGGAGRGSQCPLHAARRAAHLDRRLLQADPPVLRPRDHPDRAQHAISPDLHRRPAAADGSEPDLERLLDGEVGRRHAGRADDRFQGRSVARRDGQSPGQRRRS